MCNSFSRTQQLRQNHHVTRIKLWTKFPTGKFWQVLITKKLNFCSLWPRAHFTSQTWDIASNHSGLLLIKETLLALVRDLFTFSSKVIKKGS
jgi:hypothetical protein